MVDTNHIGLDLSEMLLQHRKRIDLVRQCANEEHESEFERKWLSVLRRCAQWFSSLPLTPELHREPGGAFRATVEIAFYAMRLAGGQKFAADLTSEKRRRLEPQYNYAVFLSAVCSALDEPYRHFELIRLSDNASWNPAANGAFGSWLGPAEYAVRRRVSEIKTERMRTAVLAHSLVTQPLLAELDPPVLADMFGAINPEKTPLGLEALVHKVVRQAVEVAADFERKAQKAIFAPVQFDVPSAAQVSMELQPKPAAPVAPPTTVALVATSAPAAAPATMAPVAGSSEMADAAVGVTQAKGPELSRTLLDALRESEAITQPDIRLSPQSSIPAAVDPSKIPAASGGPDSESAGLKREGKHGPTNEELEEVLGKGSTMILEFFRALALDIAAGKAKVHWDEKGLVLQKRLVGGYGIASDTLVEQMRKRSLLLRAHGHEICLVEKAGKLLLERPVP
jgi:conjugal transfer pilus assembly protein TraI